MSAVLTAEQALKLVGEMFVYHIPFNRALGMELERYEKEFAQLAFKNQPMMVGNWAQSILHGGVIASALDVAAGLVCVGSTLTRHETISEDELRQRLSRMGTIDLRVDYLRPGRGERFTATSSLLRAGNKVAVARVELHNEEQLYIVMSAVLTAEQALKLVGEMFVYHIPFNRALGMELERYEKEFAQLAFKNQPMMVGNWAQSILHGGVIASALDVAAGLVCVGSTLTRHETISEDELRQRLSRMGTIDLRVDYLRPGRGERFTATSSLLRAGNKVAVARVELHNEEQLYIASATATYMVG